MQAPFSYELDMNYTKPQNTLDCTCFSAINGSGPVYLSELLHVYTPSRTLRSSSETRMLKIQHYKRKSRTFSCFGPHIWNSLPQDLRHCSTQSSFKAKLKTFLLSQYFLPQLISIPSFYCSHCVCACVRAYVHACGCFHIIPYVSCFGRTVLYICIEYCIKVNIQVWCERSGRWWVHDKCTFDVSVQGVDECMINVHYYYYVHLIHGWTATNQLRLH